MGVFHPEFQTRPRLHFFGVRQFSANLCFTGAKVAHFTARSVAQVPRLPSPFYDRFNNAVLISVPKNRHTSLHPIARSLPLDWASIAAKKPNS